VDDASLDRRRRERGFDGLREASAAAGLVSAAAFFSKQTASIIGVGLGVGLLIANRRRGLVYGAAAAAALAAAVGLLVKSSDGWFWTYLNSCGLRVDTTGVDLIVADVPLRLSS
jgi:hypothetical protein